MFHVGEWGTACFFLFFFFGILCIKMLHVYQSWELNNYFSFFFSVTLLYWNENLKKNQNIPTRCTKWNNTFLHEAATEQSFHPSPIWWFVFELQKKTLLGSKYKCRRDSNVTETSFTGTSVAITLEAKEGLMTQTKPFLAKRLQNTGRATFGVKDLIYKVDTPTVFFVTQLNKRNISWASKALWC